MNPKTKNGLSRTGILLLALSVPLLSKACGGLFLGVNHDSLVLHEDYGYTTAGAGYALRWGRLEVTGMLSTPVLNQDTHDVVNDWKTGDLVGYGGVRLWLR